MPALPNPAGGRRGKPVDRLKRRLSCGRHRLLGDAQHPEHTGVRVAGFAFFPRFRDRFAAGVNIHGCLTHRARRPRFRASDDAFGACASRTFPRRRSSLGELT